MKNIKHHSGSSRFVRTSLPSPVEVLATLKIKHSRTNSRGYWTLRCPAHKEGNEQNPSMNMHQTQGNFKCHACGAKGGNILDFYMMVTDSDFKAAAKALGAWRVCK